jgi:hypothetical protein
MGIARLRRDHPTWEWTARRAGFGWEYDGRRGEARVKVYATSQLSGLSDDDYVTIWRADDGTTSETFYSWSLNDEAPW